MEKYKAIYKKQIYEVREINWDNNSVKLYKENEYFHFKFNEVEIIKPIAKDKNGIILYEGDIVKKSLFCDFDNNPSIKFEYPFLYKNCDKKYIDIVVIGVLHYTASKGVFIIKANKWSAYDSTEFRKLEETHINTSFIQKRCELIGNIYENPELLNKDFSLSCSGVDKKENKYTQAEIVTKLFKGKIINVPDRK